MHHLSAKQNELNSTDPENNLGAGAVNVWGRRTSNLNAGRFDAYKQATEETMKRNYMNHRAELGLVSNPLLYSK